MGGASTAALKLLKDGPKICPRENRLDCHRKEEIGSRPDLLWHCVFRLSGVYFDFFPVKNRPTLAPAALQLEKNCPWSTSGALPAIYFDRSAQQPGFIQGLQREAGEHE